MDISAALRSIRKALAAVKNCSTLNKDLSVYKIFISTDVLLTGSIRNGNKRLVSCTDIVTPFIYVVNINFGSTGKLHLSAGFNNKLRSGEHSNVLIINLDITLNHSDGKVVGDRKLILLGINCCSSKSGSYRNLDRRDLKVAVYLNIKSVGITVIVLNNVSAGEIKHRARLRKEGNGCIVCTQRHSNRSKAVKHRAGVNGHRNLNVLYIVLGQREYRMLYICSTVTTAEVCDLEGLIDVSAGIYGNCTCTGNVTVYVHASVNGNITIILHNDVTVTAYRTSGRCSTLSSLNNSRNAKRTVYNKLSAACHRESSECKRICFFGS